LSPIFTVCDTVLFKFVLITNMSTNLLVFSQFTIEIECKVIKIFTKLDPRKEGKAITIVKYA